MSKDKKNKQDHMKGYESKMHKESKKLNKKHKDESSNRGHNKKSY